MKTRRGNPPSIHVQPAQASQHRMVVRTRWNAARRVPERLLVLVHVLRDALVPSDSHQDIQVLIARINHGTA